MIIITTYIYTALNDALSACRIHNLGQYSLHRYTYKKNTVLEYLQSYLIINREIDRETD